MGVEESEVEKLEILHPSYQWNNMDTFNPSKRPRDEFEGDGAFEDAKRQNIDPAAELIANVCKDIRRIGENSNIVSQVEDISYISNPIVAEFEKIDALRTAILNTLYAVVIEQPQKITSLSVLILLCNPKNFLVSKYVIEFFHTKAQALLDKMRTDAEEEKEAGMPDILKQQTDQEFAGIFNNLKSVLKFLACLAPIIEDFAIVDILKQFLTLSIDLQKDSLERDVVRDGLSEEIYYNTLVAIPYLLSNSWNDQIKGHCNELLELASYFKQVEDTSYSLVEPFFAKGSNFEQDLPYRPRNLTSLIFPALKVLQKNNWQDFKDTLFIDFDTLITPIIEKLLENNTLSQELAKHQLPQLSFPSLKEVRLYNHTGLIDSLWIRSPRILFQVYNITTDFETVPTIDSYLGIFFKDLSFDILTNLSFNKNEASIQLSILDLYFHKTLFAPPGSSIDQLQRIADDNKSGENPSPLSTWKIEDIAVESILTMIFQLPLPLHVEVYYYSVLISCCKELPESIAPVFGRAIRFLYNNLQVLDYELKIRFLDWMTIQISNFEFSWKWDEWVKDSQMFHKLKYHPKKTFIKNLIAKEVRLSNKNKIQDSFITINPETGDVVKLKEFYQYLNLSMVADEENYVIDYDSKLYGNSEAVRKVFEDLALQRREKKEQLSTSGALSVSPQEALIYNFSLPMVPLNEISNTVYDFVVANWKSDSDFQDLCNSVLIAVEDKREELGEGIDKERFLVNLVFQTYVYIGSRSIYSAVSVFSRDITKLRFLAGWEDEVSEEAKDTESSTNDVFKFTPLNLTAEQFDQRQEWIIDSIFRVWNHQPQVAFLLIEYLIDFKIVKAVKLITKVLSIDTNLIIENVSCMESINRILHNANIQDDGKVGELLAMLFQLIVSNLNTLLEEKLAVPTTDEVLITKKGSLTPEVIEDAELMQNVDNQWLFYEYLGLLKSYIRKYNNDDGLELIFSQIMNDKVRHAVLSWLKEIKSLQHPPVASS